MAHPLIYVLGETQEYNFPLILIIGREPNDTGVLDNKIGIIKNEKLRSLRGGVWVTAYTQLALQYYGAQGTARKLKDTCFNVEASPIIFANAFPMAIDNSVVDKESIRDNIKSQIPVHIDNIFNSSLASRFELVIQHGASSSVASIIATDIIKKECAERNLTYIATPFFYNGNSYEIQNSLREARPTIKNIVDKFMALPIKSSKQRRG